MTNEQLIVAWQSGDDSAWEQLWRANAGLRLTAVRRFFRKTEFDEAVSTINVVFWRAAERFDPRRDAAFTTVFMHYARIESIREWKSGRAVRRGFGKRHLSVDVHGPTCDSLSELARCEPSAIDRQISAEEQAESVRRLQRLPDRYSSVVRMRCEGMTLEEIGSKIRLSRERVRQIECLALSWLSMDDEAFEREKLVRWQLGGAMNKNAELKIDR